MFPRVEDRLHPILICNLNCFVADYSARQKVGGMHLKYHYFKQLPILAPTTYWDHCHWVVGNQETLLDWLLPRVLELTYTAWDMVPFAKDCGWLGPPFRWRDERRFLIRCELDAAYFHLYGIERDDVDYIMETFHIVKRKDIDKDGEYRTKRVILQIYDEMAEAMRTRVPYKTHLDPPPADPRVAHPKLPFGVLAYGSLIGDPGPELKPKIRMRLKTTTPFPVEFGRYSKTRGDAPTLVPHEGGAPVSAEIFILDASVSPEEATDMLWRRERHREGSGETYVRGTSAGSVLVDETADFPIVTTVLYSNFNQAGKVQHPSPEELAEHAIASVQTAKPGEDGISYLKNAIEAGIQTPLTAAYQDEILKRTNTQSLDQAISKLNTEKSNGTGISA
jgi:hypothetical protein